MSGHTYLQNSNAHANKFNLNVELIIPGQVSERATDK